MNALYRGRTGRGPFAALAAVALMVFPNDAGAQESEASDPAKPGGGWSLARLDVEVRVMPERGVIEKDRVVTLRLDGLEESYGPLLLLNTRMTREGKTGIAFRHVEAPGAATEIREDLVAPHP